jgi:hypothetical protein
LQVVRPVRHPHPQDGIFRRLIHHGLVTCRRKTTVSAARGGQKPHKTLWGRIQNEIAFHRAEKIFEPVLFVVMKRTGDGALLTGSGCSQLVVITFIQDF